MNSRWIKKLVSVWAALMLCVGGAAVGLVPAAAAETAPAAEKTTLLQRVLAEDGFLNGIDYMWIDDGHTFSDNELYGFTTNTFSDGDGAATVYSDMINIKALGYNCVHIMAQGGRMEGVDFDENGHILGLSAEYKKNFRRYLEILDETDMNFAVFLQFHTTKIYSELGKEAWDRATQYYGDDTVRKEYMTLVMAPILDILKDFQHRILFLSLGDELENEINDVSLDWNYDSDRGVYGVSFEDMYSFYSDLNDLCKKTMPDIPRTIGGNSDFLYKYSELDLDAMGRNRYTQYGTDFEPISHYKTGLPMYFPEWGIACWVYDMDYDTFIQRNLTMLDKIKEEGYFGAFFWRYEHTQKSDAELTMYNTYWEYPSDYNRMATAFAYEALDDLYARQGKTPALDTPAMFAYHGDGLVTWLTSRQGDTFDLERSLDGGKTWTKLLSGAKKAAYLAPRNNEIGYYKDTTVKEGAKALYRVKAYAKGGKSALSDPSVQVTHGTVAADDAQNAGVDDKPVAVDSSKNLLKNGGFEDGLTGWTPGSNLTYKHLTGGQGHESDAALMIHDGTNRWGRMQQDFRVEEGKIYRVTFSYRDINQKGDSSMSIVFSNDGSTYNADTAFTVPFGSEDTAWHTVDVTFTSGSDTYARIRFMPDTGAGAEKHIDNVHVELVGEDTNLIENGYFSKGDAGWTLGAWNGGVCKIVEGAGANGSAAALLSGEKAYTAELSTAIIKVEKNTDYELTYRLNCALGATSGVYIKGGTSSSANKEIDTFWPVTEPGEWQQQTIRFNSGDYAYVRICFANAVDGELYMVDDVSLCQMTSKPVRYSVTDYAPTDLVMKSGATNLITDSGFEKGNGNWNVKTLVDGTAVKVVKNASVAHSGSAYLSFTGKSKTARNTAVFYVDVKPYTKYTFSAWIRSIGMGKQNDGSVTFGIIDPDTGYYLVGEPLAPEAGPQLDFSTERALVPTAFDDSWHLRGMTFNTEEMTRIGIAITGYNTQLYLDDLTLCTTAETTKYVAEENTYGMQNKIYVGELGCAAEDNLLRNYNFESQNLSFWSEEQGYGRFVQVTDASQWGYGKALKYSGSADSLGNLYVKWVDIKPNTDYVLSFSFKVTKDGDGYFGLMDGKIVNPTTFAEIAFSTDLFEDVEEEWLTMSFSFRSGFHSRVGLVIADFGGEAYLDNLRLFEKSKAVPLTNNNASNPEDDKPTPEDPTDPDDPTNPDTPADPDDPDAPTEDPDAPTYDPDAPTEDPDTPQGDADSPDGTGEQADGKAQKNKGNPWLWIGLSAGAVLLIGGGVFAFLWWRKKQIAPAQEEEPNQESENP